MPLPAMLVFSQLVVTLRLDSEGARSGRISAVASDTKYLPARSFGVPASAAAVHRIKLFRDASVVECIVDDTVALTAPIYTVPAGILHMVVREPDLDSLASLRIWELKPISKIA